VKTLAIAAKADAPYFGTDAETVLAGKYPLSRFLFIYVNRKPGTPLDPLVHQFLAYVLSREGQGVVVKDGYLPLPASVTAGELKKITD
jgi:phosphate transport system substrate-binding protein